MSGLPQFGLPRFFAIIPSDARKCYLDAKPLLKSAYFLYFISGDLGKLQIEAAQVLAKAIRIIVNSLATLGLMEEHAACFGS
jgi:hypothetical protein